jgi:hypothetical protein
LVLFIPALRFLQTLASSWDGLRDQSVEIVMELGARDWVFRTLGLLTTRAVVTVVSAVALRLAFARRTSAPRWMLAAFVIELIAEVALHSLTDEFDASAVTVLVGQLIFTAWWAHLVLTSDSVRRTFVH